MIALRRGFPALLEWITLWLDWGIATLWWAVPIVRNWVTSAGVPDRKSCKSDREEWKTNEARRTFSFADEDETRVTVQTSTHTFHVSRRCSVTFLSCMVTKSVAGVCRSFGACGSSAGGPGEAVGVQRLLQSPVPVQNERDFREPDPAGPRARLHLLQPP